MTTVKMMAHKTTADLVFICRVNQYPELKSAKDALAEADTTAKREKIMVKVMSSCAARGILPVGFDEDLHTVVFSDEDDSVYAMME